MDRVMVSAVAVGGRATCTLGHTGMAWASAPEAVGRVELEESSRSTPQQSAALAAPGEEKRGAQECAVALAVPRGQKKPAGHKPLHCEVVRDGVAPNFPAGQGRGAGEPAGQ